LWTHSGSNCGPTFGSTFGIISGPRKGHYTTTPNYTYTAKAWCPSADPKMGPKMDPEMGPNMDSKMDPETKKYCTHT